MNDVTEEALMRGELQERATFDPLTRCYNRASTMEAVEAALQWQGAGKTGALFMDLDSFKSVNDRLGHAAGDQLLASVGERLAGCVRGDDIVGRLGGDEFLVLCRDLSGTGPLMALAERAQRALAQPIILGGEAVTVQASIGACYAEHNLTADELVARADSAMYESKRQGAGRLVLFGAVPALGTTIVAQQQAPTDPVKLEVRRADQC
jgi:diguanylate cyclase (GGDEF)-like protein